MLVKSAPNTHPELVEAPAAAKRGPEDFARTGTRAGRLAWGPFQGLIYATVCVLALEVIFALAHVGENEYLMPDKVTGFTLMPNKVITQRIEGFGSFTTNSFGMQNDEITLQKPADVVRIAVFGDSFVESLHVARDKNFLQIVARDLSEKLQKKVQVLNFGVSNYSVAQDYLRYKTLAKRFKPDLVIQVFRVEESDKLLPQENRYLSLVRPVFFVGPKGELVYDGYTNVRSFLRSSTGKNMVKNEWLRRNSRLWAIAGQISKNLQSFKGRSTPDQTATPDKGPLASQSADGSSNKARYIACYWYMMDKQLESFRNECARDGAAFMIVRTPAIRVDMDSLRSSSVETSLLYQTADRLGAPILNLDNYFKQQFGCKNDGRHFLCGGHFNADMHSWVGTHISQYLLSNQKRLLPVTAAAEGPVSK